MNAKMIVRVDKNIIIAYEVDNLRPILGSPTTLAALLVNKYCNINKDWIIDRLEVFDGIVKYSLYSKDGETSNLKTIGEVIDSATSDDVGDINIVPKVKITESVINAEAM